MEERLSEVQLIEKAALEIRTKAKNLDKKYQFGLRFTYWDADDLAYKMKIENVNSIFIKRSDVTIAVMTDLSKKDPKHFTIRPDQLIEAFVMSSDTIEKMLMVQKEFSDLGGINSISLESPGLSEMELWCKGIDAHAVKIGRALRDKYRITKIYRKIWIEMGGELAKGDDRVANRMYYLSQISEAWSKDKLRWDADMKRFGLI